MGLSASPISFSELTETWVGNRERYRWPSIFTLPAWLESWWSGLSGRADPLILKMSIRYVPALRGGIALVTTLVSLIITSWITDGLQIEGLDTWILATLIVWLFGLIASLLLPVFIFKKALSDDDGKGVAV